MENTMQSPVLELCGLSKSYGMNTVLRDVNLRLPRGKIIGLLGPNGSGKTTLIKMLAGVLTPSSGTIRIADHPLGPETRAAVSYLPDKIAISESLTVTEAVGLYEYFFEDFDRPRAEKMIADLHLPDSERIKALSKGTQEKLQLILTMSRRASLYLMDEPIGGVDPATREYILNTIVGNHDQNSTVLISTHLISDVEEILDEYLFLQNGVFTRYGNARTVVEEKGMTLDRLFREDFRC